VIPKIIHQTWKSKELPENFSYWSKSFAEINPGYDHRVYDDNDNLEIVEKYFPRLVEFYTSLPKEIYRCDFVRAVYMYIFGGIYADMDFHCLRPLDEICKHDLVFGRMGTDNSFPHSIPNAFMASRPQEIFWLWYIQLMVDTWMDAQRSGQNHYPELITGPVVLKKAIDLYKKNHTRITLLPGHVLYPINWNDSLHQMFRSNMMQEKKIYSTEKMQQLFPSSIAVTYWSHTW